MATSVESRHDLQQLVLLSTAGITCTIGLTIHLFVVAVNIIDRLKGRRLTTTDLLITCIGTSRIIFQIISLLHLLWRTFYRKYSTAYNITWIVIVNSSADCNIWLSVLLSVYYSLKISNFHNVFFLDLTKIISQSVLRLIVLLVLLSIGFSSGGVLTTFENMPKNLTQEGSVYIAQIIMRKVNVLWNALPVLIYVVSSFVLLGSLCHHMHRMKHDWTIRSHLDAYLKTVKFKMVTFVCFTLYVSSKMFAGYDIDSLGFVVFFLVWNCLPVVDAMYIIHMAARLRGHFYKILQGVNKCLLFNRGSKSISRV